MKNDYFPEHNLYLPKYFWHPKEKDHEQKMAFVLVNILENTFQLKLSSLHFNLHSYLTDTASVI